MSRFTTALFSAAILVTLSGCGAASTMPLKSEAPPPSTSGATAQPSTPIPEENLPPLPTPESDEADGVVFITLDIGERSFSATLADNDAAKALAERLPLTLELSELHGNEKYIYLDEDLPTDSLQPGQIQAGDLMLYGSNCLVLFYESFESSYSYTRLGIVDDPEGLAQAVGGGGVTITFHGLVDLNLQGSAFGCSTLAVTRPNGEALFGRNFDWGNCTALIVQTQPKDGYAPISTVNMDFLNLGLSLSEDAFVRLMSVAAPYAPMDGMNEKGLCVAVLMIEDSPTFDQDTGKPDLTTTTAVRLLLDKAATVDEALDLLAQYDLHASADMMIHFTLSDATGRSVVVEYMSNEMVVTETPVVTNFYLAPGEKYRVGTEESQIRYAKLLQQTTIENRPKTSIRSDF